MPNSNNPNGFKPYMTPMCPYGPVIGYFPLNSSNSAIGKGTPVTRGASGIDRAGTTDALYGIAAENKAASAGGTIAVWCDPQQWFVAQTDDGTGTLTTAAQHTEGLNATFIGTGVTNGESDAEIDETSGATTATLLFKVIRLSDERGNAIGEFNRLVVKINNHQLQGGTGTAAV